MTTVREMKATTRPSGSKGAARAERRAGRVPGVIYGDNKDPITISVDHAELKQRVWGFSFDAPTKVADLYVHYLRRKLERAGAPDVIETVRGVGYAIGRRDPSPSSATPASPAGRRRRGSRSSPIGMSRPQRSGTSTMTRASGWSSLASSRSGIWSPAPY